MRLERGREGDFQGSRETVCRAEVERGESMSEQEIQEQLFPSTHTHSLILISSIILAEGAFHITGWLLLHRDAFQHNTNKNLDNQLDRRGDTGAQWQQGSVQSKDVNKKLGEIEEQETMERRWNWDISCVTLESFNYFPFFLLCNDQCLEEVDQSPILLMRLA